MRRRIHVCLVFYVLHWCIQLGIYYSNVKLVSACSLRAKLAASTVVGLF